MANISSNKHSKKKSPTPSDSLFPLDKSTASFALAAHATAEEMFPITTLTDAELRSIALQKNPAGAPWIPKPARGRWPTVATLRGLTARREHQASQSAAARADHISYPSMESCEGATGIPKTLQHIAKQKGSTAFRGSRVYLLPLIQWIFQQHAADGLTDWGARNSEFDAKLKLCELESKIGVDGQPGKLIQREEIETLLREYSALHHGGLRRLRLECPRDHEMRPKAYIKQSMDQKIAQLTASTQARLQQYLHQPPPASQPQLEQVK